MKKINIPISIAVKKLQSEKFDDPYTRFFFILKFEIKKQQFYHLKNGLQNMDYKIQS